MHRPNRAPGEIFAARARCARAAGGVLLAAVLVAAAPGCATPARLARAELGPECCTTWGWRPATSSTVRAPEPISNALHVATGQRIEAAMADRGLGHISEDAELQVRYRLELLERIETVHVSLAPYMLSSMNSGPSFYIERSGLEERSYPILRLSLDVSSRGGRALWSASESVRIEPDAGSALHLVVERVVGRMPLGPPRS